MRAALRRGSATGVGYRDEREALMARIQQLEGTLNQAREEIRRLKRGEEEAKRGRGEWLGAPTRIELERTIEGELPESAREELIELLRLELGELGRTEIIGRSLAWRSEPDPCRGGRRIDVRITVRNGQTRIRQRESLGGLAGGLFGGVGGGAGGGVGLSLLIAGSVAGFPLMVAGGIGFAGLTLGIVRAAYRSTYKQRERQLRRLAGDLEEVVREAAAHAPVRARVEPLDEREEEELVHGGDRTAHRMTR